MAGPERDLVASAMVVAGLAGVELDGRDRRALANALACDEAGRWRSVEVQVDAPGLVLVRELFSLFVLDEQVVHLVPQRAPYQFLDLAFRRVVDVVTAGEFASRVKKVTSANGAQGVELRSGARIRFGWGLRLARGTRPGLVVAEGMGPDPQTRAAVLPAILPAGQVWYAS